jgi:hypothetical protein
VTVPGGWEFVVVALAVFRLTRIVGWDDITANVRARVSGVTDADYPALVEYVDSIEKRGVDPWSLDRDVRPRVTRTEFWRARLVRCAWCVGFWLSVLAACAWWVDARVTLLVAFPLALAAAVGLVSKQLDP